MGREFSAGLDGREAGRDAIREGTAMMEELMRLYTPEEQGALALVRTALLAQPNDGAGEEDERAAGV